MNTKRIIKRIIKELNKRLCWQSNTMCAMVNNVGLTAQNHVGRDCQIYGGISLDIAVFTSDFDRCPVLIWSPAQIIESYACILKMFVVIDKEWSINALISFGICSTPKLSKWVTSLFFTHKATQWVAISEYS